MTTLYEFVVTLNDRADLDAFYDDMETPGGDLCIPNRAVGLVNRRPTSRNTHYMLTEDEAVDLRKDPRVAGVSRADIMRAAIRPMYIETGNFNKSGIDSSTDLNWGLARVIEGVRTNNWSGANGTKNTTIQNSLSGKNVDVLIVDGHMDPDHPEYAVNADGTGGSRVNQLDWSILTVAALGTDDDGSSGWLSDPYVYPPYDDPLDPDRTDDNNHGAHVAGTVAGNTQGWARSATIYNISPYGSNPNSLDPLIMWDYIRAFHSNKPINSETGRKNPTIANCSYGASLRFPYNYGSFLTGSITFASYRGVVTGTYPSNTPLTQSELTAAGIYAIGGFAEVPYYAPADAADIEDAIADGIIVVGAAGNSYSKIDVPGGLDYNNYFYAAVGTLGAGGTMYSWNQHRGTAPGSVPGVICVGAVGTQNAEYKTDFSNCGPRVDVYAPGQDIQSSVNNYNSFTTADDPRDPNYYLAKISGTSMASPQVTGVLACALEAFPAMTPADIMEWVVSTSKKGQLGEIAGGQEQLYSLQGSPNRYLFLKKEREDTGVTYPPTKRYIRPTNGQTYPRVKVRY